MEGLTLQLLLAAGGVIASIAASYGAVRAIVNRTEVKAEKTSEDLSLFKIKVAETYASHDAMKAVIKPLLDEMHQLRDRIDRLIDRSRSNE
jgi:DNA-directed RNA polymerase subunit L